MAGDVATRSARPFRACPFAEPLPARETPFAGAPDVVPMRAAATDPPAGEPLTAAVGAVLAPAADVALPARAADRPLDAEAPPAGCALPLSRDAEVPPERCAPPLTLDAA